MRILSKFILILSIVNLSLFAGVINGVSVVVDDEIITLYDVDELMYSSKISKEEAVDLLINEKIKLNLIKKYNIRVDYFMVEDRINSIAKSNNLTLSQFKKVLAQQFVSYDDYVEDVKNNLVNERLFSKISYKNLVKPTENELKLYYENNIGKYSTTKSFDMIQYSADSKATLELFMTNPLRNIKSVKKEDIRVDSSKLNNQLNRVLNMTKEKGFSPIIPINREFATFYIVQKHGNIVEEFKSVKDKIVKDIMDIKSKEALKESFDRARNSSKIEYIR